MENEIQKTEQVSLNQMIQMAIENKSDLGQVRELLELKKIYEADEARKDFASDFAIVQSEIGAAIKTAVNPQTHSKYAKLEGVIEASKPSYTKQGFSIIFYEGKTDTKDNIRVCADVLHEAGHKETYYLDVPLDGVGIQGNANMSKIHGKASSISYGRRYLLCMIWNIPTEDDDGNGAGAKPKVEPPKVTEQDQKIITAIASYLVDTVNDKYEGMVIDETKIAPVLISATNRLPVDVKSAPKAAKYIIDKGMLSRVIKPIKKGSAA